MTAQKIKEQIQRKYPEVNCSVPIPVIALPFHDNYIEYRIEVKSPVGSREIIGKGRTPKKAWVAALEFIN